MNLAVKIGNLHLKNPVMGASGTFGFGREYADFLDVNEIGAIVTKGVTPLPRSGNPGVRIAETPSGMLNCIGLENPGVEVFINEILPEIKKYDTAVIVNISAGTVEEYAKMAYLLDVDGVDALEVNISCPNVKEGGIVFGTDPKAAAAVTHAVKTHTSKTVIVKLSPNVTDIVAMAKAVEEAGAVVTQFHLSPGGLAHHLEGDQIALRVHGGQLAGDGDIPVGGQSQVLGDGSGVFLLQNIQRNGYRFTGQSVRENGCKGKRRVSNGGHGKWAEAKTGQGARRNGVAGGQHLIAQLEQAGTYSGEGVERDGA